MDGEAKERQKYSGRQPGAINYQVHYISLAAWDEVLMHFVRYGI
jgi:hypothetical protein